MAKLSWGAAGERFYEAGVDRGVLYVEGETGVPWNGLTSVTEKATGGEPKPYYADGLKYLNVSASEEFEASISAFSSPPEFDKCDGVSQIANGLFIGQQPRKPFHFSYRTRVGNELDGLDRHYKLHVVYNALSTPSEKKYDTLKDSPSALTLNWDITTTPPYSTAHKPTAHFTIDSRKTPKKLMGAIEDILYGSETTLPRIPDSGELVELFTSPGPVVKTNYFPINPGYRYPPGGTSGIWGGLSQWPGTGGSQSFKISDADWSKTGSCIDWMVTKPTEISDGSIGLYPETVNNTKLNEDRLLTVRVLIKPGKTSEGRKPTWALNNSTIAQIVNSYLPDSLVPNVVFETWATIKVMATFPNDATFRFNHRVSGSHTLSLSEWDLYPGPYDPDRVWFDGDSPNTNEITHYWEDKPRESKSYARSWGPI